jgi:GNAT superfamily N-acetyltransferase
VSYCWNAPPSANHVVDRARPTEVRSATERDRERVVAVLTRAFAGDAIVRFIFPDDTTYPQRAGSFFGHYFDVRLAGGEISVFGDEVAGAALWTPPGGNRKGKAFVEEHWQRTVVAALDREEVGRYEAFAAVLEAITPRDPHWYLGLLGTDPDRVRSGVGRALLTPMLERADRERLPVFLETGMRPNLDIYARFGFERLQDAVVPGGPLVRGLLRRPR